MTLTDAVANRHFVYWHDNGFMRTLEPHLFGQLQGGRSVLIAFQIAGGPAGDPQAVWKVVDTTELLTIDPAKLFSQCRPIPTHLQQLVHITYASADPGVSFGLNLAVPRR